MKLLLIVTLLFPVFSSAAKHHLPLEMSFSEYQNLYKQIKNSKNNKIKDPNVREAINAGEKMSNWIKKINTVRTEETAIRLTSKATQRGIPISKPSKYGPSTILKTLTELKLDMPKELSGVIFGKENIGETTLIGDDKFIEWCRKVSRLYQNSVRWTGMQGWLPHYSSRKAKDVRGYYFLKNQTELDTLLKSFLFMPTTEQEKFKKALVGICINSSVSVKNCGKQLTTYINRDKLIEFKNKFWKKAQKNWNSFFEITNPRTDITWNKKSPGLMEIPFKDPKNTLIADWLKSNVEDEFKFTPENWMMEMRYTSGRFGTSHLEFKRNVTPHVSGGNKIVMDANTELEEYGVKWTIRHEFGHILRIPDCYHEFYDKEQNLMINYQLDITDLMCSRVGAMNERIYLELKKHYMK